MVGIALLETVGENSRIISCIFPAKDMGVNYVLEYLLSD